MKVCLINNFPKDTGIGNYSYYLFSELRKLQGIQADIYCLGEEEAQDYNEAFVLNKYKTRPTRWFYNYFISPKKIPQGYDLYHISNQNIAYFMKINNTSIITIHDLFNRLKLGDDPFIWRFMLKTIFNHIPKADMIIANSQFTKHELVSSLNISKEKIKVIYLGVDHSIFKPINQQKARMKLGLPLNKIILLSLAGKYKGRKRGNITTLIKAYELLKNELSELLLLVVGYPSPELLKLVKKLKLTNSVKFLYHVTTEVLSLLYNSADIFVFPSLYETFGLPPLEAMACGTPVITTNLTAFPEILGKSAFFLERPFDYQLLKDLIEKLLEKKNLKKELRKNIDRAKLFNWKLTARQTAEVYDEVLGRCE